MVCYHCLPVCTPWFCCFELVVIVRDVANEHKQRPVMYDNKEMLIVLVQTVFVNPGRSSDCVPEYKLYTGEQILFTRNVQVMQFGSS